MHYYDDQNDRRPVRWAAIATVLYAGVSLLLFLFVKFDLESVARSADEILVEFVEPEPIPEPQPPRPQVAEPQMHDRVAVKDNEQQVSGTDRETRTVNPRALFRSPKGGSDEPENAGNPKAQEAEKDAASGDGGGLNPVGNAELDQGLQGRGLVGVLPKPSFPGNLRGKIVIRVTVNQNGVVTNADFVSVGSTLSDGAMIEAARQAALKARFTESRSFIEGGTITYYFNLE